MLQVGDTGMIDQDRYVHILLRADDIINVAAHRISTSSLEEVIVEHNEVAETCVVARPHSIKGSVPVVIAVLKHHRLDHTLDEIKSDLVREIRQRVGPFASLYPHNVIFVDRLPKTRSGKVLRKMIRSMISKLAMDGNSPDVCPIPTPATIEEEAVKDELWNAVRGWIKTSPQE